MHVLVLGAGLAGLSAAHDLARGGARVTVLERARTVGGMAHSFRVGPYWLDHGPHRFHTRDAGILEHLYDLLDGELVVRQRRSRIFLFGRWFDYPLRASGVLRDLPPGILARAVRDWIVERVRERVAPRSQEHFEGWVTRRFGRTLYEVFFGAYTEKAWCMPPREISADWAAQRIGQKGLVDAALKTLLPPRAGEVRSLASEFHYPRRGGIGAIGRAYARSIRDAGGELLTGAEVVRMEREGGRIVRVHARRGERTDVISCDRVVSTLPLPVVAEALDAPLPAGATTAAAELEHVGIVFVYLAVDTPSVSQDHWIYLPERHLTVHRVSEFKNFSDDCAPGDSTAVCCEITCRPGDATWRMPADELVQIATGDLHRAGLVDPGTTRPLALRRLAHAYPVYDLGYRARLQAVRAGLREVPNLTSTGRQGLFRYNNMDHSIAMGRKAARALLGSGASCHGVRESAPRVGVAAAPEGGERAE